MHQIAEEILRRGLRVQYNSFGHFRSSNSRHFETLARSGLYSLFFGLESGSQQILDRAVHKGIRLEAAAETIKAAQAAGIFAAASMIVPLPFDTAETLAESLEFVKRVRPDAVPLQFPGVFPGTRWIEEPEKYGIEIDDVEQYLLDNLDYVGVMAMECFRVGERLLINELAPRVHNSGHWTQAGASVSQFESHLRAICDLPLVTPAVRGTAVMINLLGTERDDRWLGIPECELYWYGKEVRPGRKVGHINLCATAPDDLRRALGALAPLLPDSYGEVLAWVERSLP